MRFTLIGVDRQKGGFVDGTWIQNFTGTLEEATQWARDTEEANSNRISVAVIEDMYYTPFQNVCGAKRLDLVERNSLYDDLNFVRDWIDKKEAEVPLDVLSDMSFISKECGFSYNGQWIVNPFYDETLRFGVEPLTYYGEENIKGYVKKMKQMIAGQEREPLANQIGDAEKSSTSFGRGLDSKKDLGERE